MEVKVLMVGLLTFLSHFFASSQTPQYPSLIPLPKQLTWTSQAFDLTQAKAIYYNDRRLKSEAIFLQKQLSKKGYKLKVLFQKNAPLQGISLSLGQVITSHLPEEAYQLEVFSQKVMLKANTTNGVFNGIQTFLQLQKNKEIQGCSIKDSPAFAWRGYLVDVGRNYQSISQLKEQIDVMASYKLNVFHFHLTEDVAWRLEIKKYPQLTDANTMLRQKGKFYRISDMMQLIDYCKERHIEFVPEIDMPGHSQAFERAMGVSMQSTEGVKIVKEIIKEVCQTYPIKHFHIGGDEVKITNQDFLPEMTQYVKSFGKKVIGWSPGGNLPQNTIRQLWMGHESIPEGEVYIDSRHLYINHIDPLEVVTTLFQRNIGDRSQSDQQVIGATLCLWHDRNIRQEKDLLTMNAVYPSMLAFSERTWVGGGQTQWVTNIDVKEVDAIAKFDNFEKRLLVQKAQNFRDKPFPYHPQGHIRWQLFGPFFNQGKLDSTFVPEQTNFLNHTPIPNQEALGGTVVLRHWWSPVVKGILSNPQENTTWYAIQKIWMPTDTTAYCWIGFNNISRSMATNVPPLSQWDTRASKVWVNNQLIQAPSWTKAGQAPTLEQPLTDEGYEYRQPIRIQLHKGWNEIKVKAPVGTFKGSDWQNPVKWMFTVLPFFE